MLTQKIPIFLSFVTMKTLIPFLAFCFFVCKAHAQWTFDYTANTQVASSSANDCQSIGTADGKTFVAFWKPVAAPTNYELRVQLLDAEGHRRFDDDGLLVSDQLVMSTFTMIWDLALDDSANLYIGVTSTAGDNAGFLYKLDTAGTRRWGNTGVKFASDEGYLPTLCPLPNGELAVSWLQGTGTAMLQKFDWNGDPIWTDNIPYGTATFGQATYPADLYSLTNGEILAVFHGKEGAGINSTLWANKFNSSGAGLWAEPVQLSNKTTRFNAKYSSVQDHDTVYYGFSAATGLRFDAFLQRINPDGTTWGMNGKDFDVSQTYYEMDVKVAANPGSGTVYAISRYTNSSQSQYGERVQRFAKADGSRELGDGAKEVFPLDNRNRNHATDMVMLWEKPLFIIKDGVDNGASPVTLHATWLNEDGDLFGSTFPVALFAAPKGRVTLNQPRLQGAVVVFTEDKGSGEKIYAQFFINPLWESVSAPLRNTQTVQAWPNPARELLTVKSNASIQEVNLVNPIGQLVYRTTAIGERQYTFSAGTLKPGMYRLRIISGDGSSTAIPVVLE